MSAMAGSSTTCRRGGSMLSRGLEAFFVKWLAGPAGDTSVRREIAHTIGARKREKPGFKRNMIMEPLQALGVIRRYRGRENVYASIAFYDPMERPLGYHYLYYDFDCKEDPQYAIRRGLEFARSLQKTYGCTPITYLSGHKGLGVVVVLKDYVVWPSYEALWRALAQPYSFGSILDPQVLCYNRLQRIPYTHNIKPSGTGMPRLVTLDGRPVNPTEFDWSNYEPLDPRDVKVYAVESSLPLPKPVRLGRGGNGEKIELPESIEELAECEAVPPCIRNIVNAMVSAGDIDHSQRLVLVWYLRWVGYDAERIIEFFARHAKDYSERVTRYQVEYAFKRGYLVPSCKTLREKEGWRGICLGCGWDRNPVTYTYARSRVPEGLRQKFFQKAAQANRYKHTIQ